MTMPLFFANETLGKMKEECNDERQFKRENHIWFRNWLDNRFLCIDEYYRINKSRLNKGASFFAYFSMTIVRKGGVKKMEYTLEELIGMLTFGLIIANEQNSNEVNRIPKNAVSEIIVHLQDLKMLLSA